MQPTLRSLAVAWLILAAGTTTVAAERKLPEAAKSIFDAADTVTAYSLEPVRPKNTTKETFHDWIVRSKAEVTGAEDRKTLLGGMEKLITNPGKGGARCFEPHHAIRATK